MPEDIKQQVAALDGKTDTLLELAQDVHRVMGDVGERVKGVETSQAQLVDGFNTLNKAIYLGNGVPPVMSRLVVLEKGLDELRRDVLQFNHDIRRVFKAVSAIKNSKMLSRNQIIAGSVGIIFTAVVGMAAAVLSWLK